VTKPESGLAGAVAAFYDALIAQDAQRAIALLSTDVAWTEAPGSPYGREDGGPYRGRSEVAEHVLAPQGADVAGLRLAQHEMLAYGNTIIVLGTAHGHGARTGATLALPFAHVWVLDETAIREFRQYIDTDVFRDVVGKPVSR
jgi:ketosteroid isomerase-like protein